MTNDLSIPDELLPYFPNLPNLPKNVKRLRPEELPDLDNAVKDLARSKLTNRARLAKAMGMSSPTLTGMIKGRDPRIGLLLALSEALQVNLLNDYLRLLPENLRNTTETDRLQVQLGQLQKEKDALQAKLTAAERERDLLLSILQAQR